MANNKTAKDKKREVKERTKLVKMEVVVDQLGQYKKGDIIEMHPSTAAACEKNGVVAKPGKN